MLQQRMHARAAAARCQQQPAAPAKAVLAPSTKHKARNRRLAAAGGDGEADAGTSSSSSSRPGDARKLADTHTQQQEQQQQQQTHTPGYDPKAAAGFMPAPGEKPMWWVEKFEERRKKLAEEHVSSSSSSSSKAGASTNTSLNSSSASSSSSSVAAWFPKAVLQLLQLAVVNAALILWPASLHPGGLAAGNVWLAFVAYMLFFAGGSVYRLVAFGPLAARKQDAQGRTWWSTAAWLLFVISIPVIHWPPVGAFLQRQQMLAAAASGGTGAVLRKSVITGYDVLGAVLLAAAVGLNWWAARTLGRAYDRVVAPDALVSNGPYKYVQHPIYSSYMLLFVGYGLLLHSMPTALLALGVCLVYYLSRTRLEQEVLQEVFGQQYNEYRQRTKLFVPCLL